MKNILLLIIIFITSILNSTTAQKCLVEGIKFETQKQIDDFPLNHPGCVEIIGGVLIESNNSDAISNLDSLSQITSIGGYLKIWKNESLKNLLGLNNLSYLGEYLEIVLNKKLLNLKGLNNLTAINEYLKVSYNPSLTSLIGLDNIKLINHNLSIRSNNALLSLNGLEMLDTLNGNLGIIKNNSLLNLNGLNNLRSIEKSISIRNNNSLMSLSGLQNVNAVDGVYDIYENPSLHDFTALENLIPKNQMTKIIENQKESEIKHKEYIVKAKEIELKKIKAKVKYKFWISSMDNSSNLNGYLLEAKDSSMVVSYGVSKEKSNIRTQNIRVNNIKTIKYRKNGRIVKGLVFGALTGFVIGALIGKASGDDNSASFYALTAQEKTWYGGIVMTVPGALIGGLIGKAKIKIPINGSQNTYSRQRDKLEYLKIIY